MEMKTWFTSQDVMEQLGINAVTLSSLIAEGKLPFYSISTLTPIENWEGFQELKRKLQPELFPLPAAPTDLRGMVRRGPHGMTFIDNFGGDIRTMPKGTGVCKTRLDEIRESLEIVVFRKEDVVEPEIKQEGGKQQAVNRPHMGGLSEKERALKTFADKHSTLTTPMIVKKWIASKPDCMYDSDRILRPGFKQGTLEKTLNRLRKSAK